MTPRAVQVSMDEAMDNEKPVCPPEIMNAEVDLKGMSCHDGGTRDNDGGHER